MTGHKRLEEEEGFSQITHVRSDSPYVNGDNSNRPSSRQHVGTEIAFHDVCYVVPVKEKGERHLKSLLNRVSGVMKPGLHAILGPTGSGKTTLLDILAGRKNKRYLIGDVLVNGKRQPNNFKLVSGYVVQDDVVMGTLTVRENLMFSAALRLPSELGTNEKRARVEMIINDLGLNKVADSKVGNELIRGVSGGERKRTSIGMELITSPDVLFLDEPTTGLDAATASSVMQLLCKQAKRGRTIIFSIHQPRYTIFKLFGTLTLLSAGEMVYHGPKDLVLPYFEKLGYVCEEHNNPPDFLLDVIDHDERELKGVKAIHEYNSLASNDGKERYIEEARGQDLARRYCQTELYKDTMQDLNSQIEELHEYEESGRFDDTNEASYPTSCFTQFAVVSKRGVKNLIRNPKTGISQIMINLLMAVIIGLIYLRLDLGESGLQNRIGVFFFLTMNMIFGNMNAVQLFIEERVIFVHECASGYYRVSAYFLSKVICDLIPMRIIPVALFAAVTYWMIGFQSDAEKFLIYILTLVLTSLSSVAVCFAVSSSTKIFALASLFTVLPYIFMMIFSGMLINLKTMTKYLNWLKYLSIFRYSLSTLEINELEGLKFDCHNRTAHCVNGDQYLDQQGIKVTDLWDNIMALGVITLILLIISYIQLRRIRKDK